MQHRYLFILEITPVEVGKTYGELPSHLTLMSRFFSDSSPEKIAEIVKPVFAQQPPINLVFGEMKTLGPKQLRVHMIKESRALRQLHNQLRTLLDSVNVVYEYPQFIGDNHKPHVTKRDGVDFAVGDSKITKAAYLVEIIDGERVIRSKFQLLGK